MVTWSHGPQPRAELPVTAGAKIIATVTKITRYTGYLTGDGGRRRGRRLEHV